MLSEGEMAQINNVERTATAVAISDVELLAIANSYIKDSVKNAATSVSLYWKAIMERYRNIHARLVHVVEGFNPS